eukprot:TRINITY_DN49396_c0_g1_i2.p1 TRINITY_DN49396_c0_g1~~TRINITY_DN49396_c0_g1_i2.p1  ORF type:complete len:325 (-),score=65.26 TRINITY_DN49396_c0_g1_i2:125-1099(-)
MCIRDRNRTAGGAATAPAAAIAGGGGEEDEEVLRNADVLSGITSYHVRVSKVDGLTGEVANVVQDEQFTAGSAEYTSKCWSVRGLRPGGRYAASVRASTGLLWGVWSENSYFNTNVPCNGSIRFVADTFVALEWNRPEYAGGGLLSKLHCWEVKFATLGSTQQQHHGGDADAATDEGIRRLPANGPMKHFLGDLLPNTAYSTQVRPVYPHEGGAWSTPQYFVTLPLLVSDVGRVGETFVAVEWERGPQASTFDCMHDKSHSAVSALKRRLEVLRQRASGGGAEEDVLVGSQSGSERQPPGGNSTRSNSGIDSDDDDEPLSLIHI